MTEIAQLGNRLIEEMLDSYLDNQQKLADSHQFMLGVGLVGTAVSIPLGILVALGITLKLKNQMAPVKSDKSDGETISDNNLINNLINLKFIAIAAK
ncbi:MULTISPECIES: hypothetical protein [Planktothricoides]|uniref:Uncharacterized protein n=1 Tax=Planktothricoides raciborskii FACHB-1370 TaxID=2949576 RepID=A0ABR8EA75_9CYAN|nr:MULTISPECIES: hypothetical protein [Planktothricoides]KOR38311.1 hypothetical protein AM228_01710 [Planktothricoides sp. SR001]MBD2543380.1 hypothetical protein [Planktothricoides raciborskii FACHB-1370]MBD2581679.1 hypothetical protein [Planktothricoides raciborskii FACHB-1261]